MRQKSALRTTLVAGFAGLLALSLSACSLPNFANFFGVGDPVRDQENNEIIESGDANVFAVRVGDCFNDDGVGEDIFSLPVVPCAEPHDNEIYADVIMSGSEYPGEEAIWDYADEACYQEFPRYVGTSYEKSTLDFWYLYPTAEGWDTQNDRLIQCVVFGDDQLTGSVKNSRL